MDLDDEELYATRKAKGLLKKEKCLHCGGNKAAYCEECYQELIAENVKLQEENKELEEKIKKQKQLTKLAQIITDESLKEALEEFEKDYIPKSKIKEIRDKAEVMDYYTLPDVIEDLNKLLEEG